MAIKRIPSISLVVICALVSVACGNNTASTPTNQPSSDTTKVVTAKQPTAGSQQIDGQTTTIHVTSSGFDTARIVASPGVVTIRLDNPSPNPIRIGLRQGNQVLAESDPAAGKQLAEITIPVESGKTYTYFIIGKDDPALTGTLRVD